MIKKSVVMQLALGTLIGMPLIALLIDRYANRVDLAGGLVGHFAWYIQLAVGLASGLAAGFTARWIISRPFMAEASTKYATLLGQFKLTGSEILFVSLCAGVGEEMLFRGAIQPFLGPLLTAMIFVAIHGYLNPSDWKLSLYGLAMTIMITGIGLIADYVGLIPAIIAHTLIDVVLLQNLQKHRPEVLETAEEE